jgi:predicted porin
MRRRSCSQSAASPTSNLVNNFEKSNMKKNLLALAVLGAFAAAASAQTTVTIYGVADAGISYKDNGAATNAKTWGVDSGLQSGSRLGFKGSEDLGGGLSAFFTLENGYSIDNGTLGQSSAASSNAPAVTRLFGRQAWVGLNGGFGAVKFGRQYNPIRHAAESIDPFALGLAGNISNVFKVYGERADNTINYSTPTLGGFSGQLAYGLGEISGNNSAGRQIGLSAGYANGPIAVIVAHHDQNLLTGGTSTTAPATPNGKEKSTFLGGSYDFKVAKAHAAYAVNKGEGTTGATTIDSRDMMIGLSAPVGNVGSVMASYIRRDDKRIANGDANQWALGYTHNLSKSTNLYTSYARTKNDAQSKLGSAAANGNDPSTFNVGIRHKF